MDKYLYSFLWNFRGYVTKQRNVAYVLSGSMGLQDNLISEIASQNGAFGGRMLTVNINPFSKQASEDYLNERAPELNLLVKVLKGFANHIGCSILYQYFCKTAFC